MNRTQKKLYELKAEVIAAMGHPIRLAAIDFLKQGEQCVCDIAEAVGAKRSNVSRHLAVLLGVGIVECRKDGLKMMYSLKTPCVTNFLDCVVKVLRKRASETKTILAKL